MKKTLDEISKIAKDKGTRFVRFLSATKDGKIYPTPPALSARYTERVQTLMLRSGVQETRVLLIHSSNCSIHRGQCTCTPNLVVQSLDKEVSWVLEGDVANLTSLGGPGSCDFCDRPARWRYRLREGYALDEMEACSACHRLIEHNDLEGLVLRTLEVIGRKGLQSVDRISIRESHQRVFELRLPEPPIAIGN